MVHCHGCTWPHWASTTPAFAGQKEAQSSAADSSDVREARQAWTAPSSRLSTSSDTATPPSPGEKGAVALVGKSLPSSQVLPAGSYCWTTGWSDAAHVCNGATHHHWRLPVHGWSLHCILEGILPVALQICHASHHACQPRTWFRLGLPTPGQASCFSSETCAAAAGRCMPSILNI